LSVVVRGTVQDWCEWHASGTAGKNGAGTAWWFGHQLIRWVRPVFAAARGAAALVAAPLVLRCSALRIRQHVAKLWERSHVELPCLEDDVGLLVFGPAEEEHDPAHVGRQRRSAAHDQVTRQPRDREHG
jgi:hypothetical protein